MKASKAQRTMKLINALSERRVIHLSDAAALLGVSEMTVRRDVAENTDQFAYLGGHIMSAAQIEADVPYELATAADSHAAAKRDACLHAVRKIRPDETIFIDCGTTLIHLDRSHPGQLPNNSNMLCHERGRAPGPQAQCDDHHAGRPLPPGLGIVFRDPRFRHPRAASASTSASFRPPASTPSAAPPASIFTRRLVKQKVMAPGARELSRRRQQQDRQVEARLLRADDAFDAIITEHGETSLQAFSRTRLRRIRAFDFSDSSDGKVTKKVR